MTRQYRRYSNEDIIKTVPEVKSMAQLLTKLGLRAVGGNYYTMKRRLQILKLECSHWTGKAWSKGQQLKDWSEYSRVSNVKPYLIRERGYKCERCNREMWEGEIIPLEIDHVNGDRTNHNLENLKLLCCNCHALTPTWKGRNAKNINQNEPEIIILSEVAKSEKEIKTSKIESIKIMTYKPCLFCGAFFSHGGKFCTDICSNRFHGKQRIGLKCKIQWPTIEQIQKRVDEMGYSAAGRSLGVSDNAIRKHLKNHAKQESSSFE